MAENDIHVTPVGDRMGHYEDRKCWCNPSILQEPDCNVVVVHNSADGREFHERYPAGMSTFEICLPIPS
jgi:hypothetical protein